MRTEVCQKHFLGRLGKCVKDFSSKERKGFLGDLNAKVDDAPVQEVLVGKFWV